MFEYGFENFKIATVLTTLYPVAEIQVNQSASTQAVALAPSEELRCLVSANYDPEAIQLDVKLKSDSVDAPVEAGTVLGRVTVLLDGKVLGTCDLSAITSVSRSEITHQVQQTKNYVEDNWWKWLVGILVVLVLMIVVCLILLQVYRRKERMRKVAARRRALELQQRKQSLNSDWMNFKSEE